MPPWLRQSGGDVVVSLHVQPGAKRSEVAGCHGEALKIRLAAPPVDGKANDCLIEFVAGRLGIPRARVSLLAGRASREKRLCLHDVDLALAESRLLPG
jgi:uncharacterized protein (TIGR00251 family)